MKNNATGEVDPMQGEMLEADFVEDTITFKLQGHYYARAGTYIILRIEEYQALKEPLTQDEYIQRMRKDKCAHGWPKQMSCGECLKVTDSRD
jgi:hypothetical protein